MVEYGALRARLKAALAKKFPGVSFDLNWIKEPDHDWHDGGDPIIDRWHCWYNSKGSKRPRPAYVPTSTPSTTGAEIPF